MSAFWRTFIAAALGKLFINLLLALCVYLGFGSPNDWVAFMITGLPAFITPGAVRLGLLLIASVGLFLEWRGPLQSKIVQWRPLSRSLAQIVFVIGCCVPFVAGAFYLTATPTLGPVSTDRHLEEAQKQLLAVELAKIPSDQRYPFLVSCVEDPEAMAYAIEFIYFFKYYQIPIREYYADPPDNTLLIPWFVKEISKARGVSISLRNIEKPPDAANALLAAMRRAGFEIEYERFFGQMPLGADFILVIRYR